MGKAGNHTGRIGLGILLLTLATSVPSSADVTIKRQSSFSGLGGVMNSEITSVEAIAGDKSATESETRMTNKVVKFLGGGKPVKTTAVVRLDKGLWWDINHKEKKYTETTLAQMKAMMDSLGMMFGSGAQGEQKPAFDTTEMTFSPPTFEVKQTGQKAVIAGQDCDESILTMTTEGTNKKTGEKMKLIVTMAMMLAQNVPGAAEQEAFGRKMVEALGLKVDKNAQSMMGMLEAYGIDPETLAAEAEKMQGFAMRTTMKFRMEGAAGQQTAQAQPGGESGVAEDTATAVSEEEGSTGGKESAVKAIGGLFGKKNKDKDKGKKTESAKAESGKPAAAPDQSMFSLSTEVTEISTASVAPERFELPAGYKKEKNRMEKK